MHSETPFSTGVSPAPADFTTKTNGLQAIGIQCSGRSPGGHGVPTPGRVAWAGDAVQHQPLGSGSLLRNGLLLRMLVLLVAASYVVVPVHGGGGANADALSRTSELSPEDLLSMASTDLDQLEEVTLFDTRGVAHRHRISGFARSRGSSTLELTISRHTRILITDSPEIGVTWRIASGTDVSSRRSGEAELHRSSFRGICTAPLTTSNTGWPVTRPPCSG
jgi:hypothetical protein